MSENPFGITREEILELAATKLANEHADYEGIESRATKIIQERIKDAFATKLTNRIDSFLVDEMEKLIGQEICPVDIYGERTGNPTTIRAVLAHRAKVFWEVKVNSEGREESYGGKPRHQWLFEKIVNEEFNKAIQQNITNIVGAFKDALKADAAAVTAKHIESLIHVKTR